MFLPKIKDDNSICQTAGDALMNLLCPVVCAIARQPKFNPPPVQWHMQPILKLKNVVFLKPSIKFKVRLTITFLSKRYSKQDSACIYFDNIFQRQIKSFSYNGKTVSLSNCPR